MKRTLITGAAGFVGANLARCLLQDGYEVHLLLRHTNDNWRLREISAECRIVVGDIRDPEAVRSAVRSVKPQSVFHLAAYGAYSQQTGFQEMAATNLLGSAALLDACVETGVERFVQTGSSSEYGYKDHAASELEVLDPNSHYAITKAAATHYCTYTARTTGIRAVTARLYSVYGPYEEPSRLIPTLLVHGLKGKLPPLVSPATARDFVHVDDAVRALLELATRDQVRPGAVYNVATGTQTTLGEIVQQARAILDIAAEPKWGAMQQRSWDTDVWVGNPSAIGRDIGWVREITVREGLLRTIDWFRNHPEWLTFYDSRIFSGNMPG